MSHKVIRFDDFVKRPMSRRANLVARGVLKVRRSASEMKRNAEIGLLTKSSRDQRSASSCSTVRSSPGMLNGLARTVVKPRAASSSNLG